MIFKNRLMIPFRKHTVTAKTTFITQNSFKISMCSVKCAKQKVDENFTKQNLHPNKNL
jgi:hypothetical protein